MARLLLHLENSRVQGITPSMLDSIRIYAKSYGIEGIHVIDCTEDGYHGTLGDDEMDFVRWPSLAAWRDSLEPEATVVGIETQNTIEAAGLTATSLMELEHPPGDVWYAFGPSMGFAAADITEDSFWAYIPVLVPIGGFNSREAVTLVLAHRFFMTVLGG
jgi:hypothetical protein